MAHRKTDNWKERHRRAEQHAPSLHYTVSGVRKLQVKSESESESAVREDGGEKYIEYGFSWSSGLGSSV